MLNKLRNRFILINTLMVGALIVLIIISISALSLYQEYKTTTKTLSYVVSDKGELENYSTFLFAFVSDTKEVSIIENTLFDYEFDEKNLSSYAADILSAEKETGIILKYRIIYERKRTENGYFIAFSSIDRIVRTVDDIFSSSSSVGAVALFLLFLLSRKLSKVVIKPVERAWSAQKRFIADASHDLKTPLTVIMANNEIMLSHPEKTVSEQMKWLESTRDEGEYMTALINRMLELAKTENLLEKIKLEDTNISEITEKAVLQLEPLAFESGVSIESEIEPDIVIKSSGTEFYKLAQILIDNAVKYAPYQSVVFVSLSATKKEATLIVNNKGEVIPQEQLEHIFDRFYRADDSRTKGGFGLGLSIAQNVASALGGSIVAQSDNENGTAFTVTFKI